VFFKNIKNCFKNGLGGGLLFCKKSDLGVRGGWLFAIRLTYRNDIYLENQDFNRFK